tara:strand:- start:267 stop:695 length:429 start_codon:yes stop_codon:yes gene_type:complete
VKGIKELYSIYSKIEKELILHQFYKPEAIDFSKRTNISPVNESLQVSHLTLEENQTFKPHKHILYERSMPMAQESWVVISGEVEVIYYDIDDKVIELKTLSPGDVTITYRGGHNYRALKSNTIVYEFKTGPYLGIDKDKVHI